MPAPWSDELLAAYAATWAGADTQLEFTSPDETLVCLASLRARRENDAVREVIVSCVEITELKHAQAEAQKLALVAARTDNAVVLTDASGRIEWINEGFTRITGYTFEEVRGRKPGSFLQGPETDPATIRLMREQLRRGEGFRTEVLNYGKGGRKYWLALEVQPIHDACGRLARFMAVESDVTARRQTEENLRVQFSLARALAGALSVADARQTLLATIGREMNWTLAVLWIVAPDGETIAQADHWPATASDDSALIQFGRSLRLRRGQGLPGRVWASASIEWRSDLTCDPACPRATLARSEGLHCSVGIPLHAGGDVLGVAEFLSQRQEAPDEARLLTFTALGAQIGQYFERIQAEESLRLRGEELLRANTELARASHLKNAFLASMSHELRTPLNSILGLSESLASELHGPLNERQHRYIDLLATSGQHLLALINDILDLAKIESGQQELELQPCSVAELCEAALQLVAPMAAKRGQSVARDMPGTDLLIQADPRRFKQILVNLLGNAVKFTAEQGQLGLRVQRTDTEIRLEIWDRGIGIAAEDLPRLFIPFQQLDTRLSREYSGTGLGLSLVKQLTALHGGRVEVSSRLGEGSCFSIILPATVIVAPPPRPATSAPLAEAVIHPPAPESAPSPLVLLVEDTPMNTIAITDYLEAKGYRVRLAENGRIAIEQTVALRPALILMDVQMPVLDGIEATRAIRALPDRDLAATPIIAVTALAMSNDRDLCLAAGVDDYVAKPYRLSELHQKITDLLARPRNARA